MSDQPAGGGSLMALAPLGVSGGGAFAHRATAQACALDRGRLVSPVGADLDVCAAQGAVVHGPDRSDLVTAVFRHKVDACADTAATLAADYEPFEALVRRLHRFTEFVAAEHGLYAALHSGNPAFEPLPAYFRQRLEPALGSLLTAAATAGEIRADVEPGELLSAVSRLCPPARGDHAGDDRVVALLIDGLRYGAEPEPRSAEPRAHSWRAVGGRLVGDVERRAISAEAMAY